LWNETEEEAEFELSQLKKLIELNSSILNKFQSVAPAKTDLWALATILHSFHMGMESIFKRIAKNIDGGVPPGPSWHKELVESMAKSNSLRPAVISQKLKTILEKYLTFRQAFLYLSSCDLEWREMKPLIVGAKETLNLFDKEISAFFAAGKKEG